MELVIFLLISLVILVVFFYKYLKYIKLYYKYIDDFNEEFNKLKENYICHFDKENLKECYRNLRNEIKFKFNSKIKEFIFNYDNIDKLVDEFNEIFIKLEMVRCKDYFDNMFTYSIDDEQRRAIITDDNNNLIIAGAGSGKTTTIIGKTKYLIEKKNVSPSEIITISFTNAAKDNFIEKLGDSRVSCSTFHKLGKDILEEDNIRLDIASTYLDTCIREYMHNEIYKDSDKAINFVNFYSYYMHLIDDNEDLKFGEIIEREKGIDFETIKSKYLNYKNLNTMKNEKVKSEQELIIANYLFLHGIKYEYEAKYKYDTANKIFRQYHPDFYLVDYDIYLEHFGINKNNRAPQFNEFEEKRYLDGIKAKREIHEKNNTIMIETYSYDFDNYNIENVLYEKLTKAGVVVKNIDYKEIVNVISSVKNDDMNLFYKLVSKFIKMFKGNNYSESMFDDFYKDAVKKKNRRNMSLLRILKDVYVYYQYKLKENNYIDFDDMINMATDKVNKTFNKKISYIIIDEFQDISYSRYALVKAIQNKTGAKVVAVGDDWQSIYRFSGCDLDLFVNFDKYFSNPKIMYISNTYRNCQNLINLSSEFIMKNENGQIKKSIKSDIKNIDNPIHYYFYKYDVFDATLEAIKDLRKDGCKNIAILGRNNSDIKKYNKEVNENKKEIDMSDIFGSGVIFTTVHKSKGLEYDGVIICNLENYIAGFPNKMLDDPILSYVSLTKDDYLYEEERRLFYVALTRTKSKCMLLVPIMRPSIFVDELMEISNNTIVKHVIEDDERLHNPKCPRCSKGILIVRKNPNDNSEFVGCSNYPMCDFTYSKKDIIEHNFICPICNGYLVKRNGKDGEFYGCINYPYCTQTAENENGIEYRGNIF